MEELVSHSDSKEFTSHYHTQNNLLEDNNDHVSIVPLISSDSKSFDCFCLTVTVELHITILILGVCILLRVWVQGEGFLPMQRYYSSFYYLFSHLFLPEDGRMTETCNK
jgi:hypothetical protein